MPDFKHILYEQDDRVVTITFNRPETMNALNWDMEEEMHEALDVAARDASVRAVILTGAGRAFSSGYDMSADYGRPPRNPMGPFLRESHERISLENRGSLHIMESPKPVIAAVNGWCMGGAFFYSLACDITISSDRAVYALPEVRHGSNSTFLFALLAGWKVAHRYTLTGDHFDANEAMRIGVVNEVVPHDDLMSRARALAERLAKVPADSLRLNKFITTYGWEAMGLHAAMNAHAMLSAMIAGSHDGPDIEPLDRARAEGGMRKFLEVRDGPFQPEPFGPRSGQ